MIKKAVLLAVLLVALSLGTAFADQIDSLGSLSGAVPPTNVYVNPGGLGDALIYGYYNVRDNRDAFFNVVNTSVTYGVRATIRFMEASDIADQVTCTQTTPQTKEARGSLEVLDFHICLTPEDVWSGQIKNVGGVATLFSNDDDTYVDISNPRGSNSKIFADDFPSGQPFSTLVASPDDTLEGYFMVIALNRLAEVTSGGNCGPSLRDDIPAGDVDNVLFGINYMVDFDTLATFAYDATALGDFSDSPYAVAGPVDATPNLQDCRPDCAASTPAVAPVNYALTKSNIYSTYDVESLIAGKTEVIVTYPTKRNTQLACQNNDLFDDTRVKITIYDDEERAPQATCAFSPCPGGTDIRLPYEVNVLKINTGSNIFTSRVETLVSTSFQFGWVNIDLTAANTSVISPMHATSCTNVGGVGNCTTGANGAQVSNGLPAIGYTAIDIAGGASTHLLPVQYSTKFGAMSVQ